MIYFIIKTIVLLVSNEQARKYFQSVNPSDSVGHCGFGAIQGGIKQKWHLLAY